VRASISQAEISPRGVLASAKARTQALVVPDDRLDYGETRWLALGLIGKQLFSLAFTLRDDRIRVISLRRASRKERKLYDGQNQG